MTLMHEVAKPIMTAEKKHLTNHLDVFLAVMVLTCMIGCNLILSGCATPNKPGLAPLPTMEPDAISMKILSAETELSRNKQIKSGTDEKAGLLLRLAMLYVHPDNPDKNYQRAIDYLEQYLRLKQTVNARYALSLLTRLSECVSTSDSTCDKTKKENKELKEKCKDLTRENLYHKEVIEKLKSLDIQLEEKRKSID